MAEDVTLIDELRALAARERAMLEQASRLATATAHLTNNRDDVIAQIQIEADIHATYATAMERAADALETLALIATHRLAVEALTDEHEVLYFECAGPHGVYEGDTIEEAVRKAVAGYRKEPTT